MNIEETKKDFYDRLSEIYKIGCIAGLLDWDQRVYMPTKAAEARAEQIEYLSLMLHKKSTDPELLRIVDELNEVKDSLPIEDQVNIREMKRALDIERKLPPEYVSEMTNAATMGYSTWVGARPKNDFKAVEPYLERIVELSRKRADLVGYTEHPYDALLDIYEPGAKLSWVKPLLLDLAEQLREIIPQISEKFAGLKPLEGNFPTNAQAKLCHNVAEKLGFSFESGRFDITAHPFMTTLGPADFRITSRYDESDMLPSLYSTIHETGHALYELGMDPKWAGTPMAQAVSLGIHESQSRMWENLVGRSREFMGYLTPVVKEFFPEQLSSVTPDELWMQVNRVHPSLIRTEADEVTYSQHIVIRMLLEEALITGELKVADAPAAWNDLYKKYLGVTPPDYKNGVMQDVHWYHGGIGYFPTYALGNLYGAMMMTAAKAALPNMSDQISKGDFGGLLGWLRENVHKHGMRYKGPELIKNISGSDLSAKPFVDYLKAKFLG